MVRQVPHVNPCAGPGAGLFASAPPARSSAQTGPESRPQRAGAVLAPPATATTGL